MTIGERIKQRRLELGLTQLELAHKMGLTSKTTICKAETSDFNPTTDRVREFAKALDCTPAYLMGWEESQNKRLGAYAKEFSELNKNKSINNVPLFNSEKELNEAVELYEKYTKAAPEVKTAVEILLKSQQQES